MANTPWGASVSASASRRPAPDDLDADLAAAGQRLDLVELGRRLEALGEQQPAHRSAAGRQQLAHGAAALDPVAAERVGRPVPTGPRLGGRSAGGRARRGGPVRRAPAGAGSPVHRRPGRLDSTSTTASEAIPSPAADRPQAVGRGGLDRDRRADHARPRRAAIAVDVGASRGASATTVQSAFTRRSRRPPTWPTTSVNRSRLSAPAHAGSVSGKCRPMSPRPAAPSSASASAWATRVGVAVAGQAAARPRCAPHPARAGGAGSSEKAWTSKPWPMRMLTACQLRRSAQRQVGRRR